MRAHSISNAARWPRVPLLHGTGHRTIRRTGRRPERRRTRRTARGRPAGPRGDVHDRSRSHAASTTSRCRSTRPSRSTTSPSNSVAVADADQTVIIGQVDTRRPIHEPCRSGLTPRSSRRRTPRRCPTARRCRRSTRLRSTSLLDLDVNVDAALDLAAPVDAAHRGQRERRPADRRRGLRERPLAGRESGAAAEQVSVINQELDGVAIATGSDVRHRAGRGRRATPSSRRP